MWPQRSLPILPQKTSWLLFPVEKKTYFLLSQNLKQNLACHKIDIWRTGCSLVVSVRCLCFCLSSISLYLDLMYVAIQAEDGIVIYQKIERKAWCYHRKIGFNDSTQSRVSERNSSHQGKIPSSGVISYKLWQSQK